MIRIWSAVNLFPILLLFAGCQELSVRNNYSGFRADEEIAVFSQKGRKFRIQGDLNSPVDRLNLIPGTYMIEFVDQLTSVRGAAYCDVVAGKQYHVEARGFRDFPGQMKRVIIADCVGQPPDSKN